MAATGWWEAFAFVWVIGCLNLTYAAGIALGVHPTAFLLEAFLFGGISLLLIAGPGENAHKIILAPQTWAYGAATIAGEIFYYLMIVFVPPADASVFMRVTILLTIVLGWLAVGRRITPMRGLGMAIVLIGLFITGYFFPATHSVPFLAATLASAASMSVRNLLAEFHPWNRRGRTVIEKMRVTGLVVLATSIAGLIAASVLAALVAYGLLPPLPALPPVHQFLALPTVVLALTMGCVIITAMQYLMFSSVVKITSENFFAVASLSPLMTLILQEGAARLGLIGAGAAGWGILPFMLLILLGNLLIAWRGGVPAGDHLLGPVPVEDAAEAEGVRHAPVPSPLVGEGGEAAQAAEPGEG
jgi:drug/metabolite transporter (DMT)-like permease